MDADPLLLLENAGQIAGAVSRSLGQRRRAYILADMHADIVQNELCGGAKYIGHLLLTLFPQETDHAPQLAGHALRIGARLIGNAVLMDIGQHAAIERMEEFHLDAGGLLALLLQIVQHRRGLIHQAVDPALLELLDAILDLLAQHADALQLILIHHRRGIDPAERYAGGFLEDLLGENPAHLLKGLRQAMDAGRLIRHQKEQLHGQALLQTVARLSAQLKEHAAAALLLPHSEDPDPFPIQVGRIRPFQVVAQRVRYDLLNGGLYDQFCAHVVSLPGRLGLSNHHKEMPREQLVQLLRAAVVQVVQQHPGQQMAAICRDRLLVALRSLLDSCLHGPARSNLLKEFTDGGNNGLVALRLEQVMIGLLPERLVGKGEIVIPGEEDHMGVEVFLVQFLHQLQTRHARHLNIADEDVTGGGCQQLKHLGGVVGHLHNRAFIRQRTLQQLTQLIGNDRLIIHHNNVYLPVVLFSHALHASLSSSICMQTSRPPSVERRTLIPLCLPK